jgi:hypothetical protein
MYKTFFDYLIESKQLYEFKIKIAGDLPDDAESKIESALAQFDVHTCKLSKSTPIQKHQPDFPSHSNISVSIFDVITEYPSTTPELRTVIASALAISLDCIKVRTALEDLDITPVMSDKPLLNSPYEKVNHQDLYGDKFNTPFLKELNKMKHTGTQYKGVNDKILASKSPKGSEEYKSSKADSKISTKSIVGSTTKGK